MTEILNELVQGRSSDPIWQEKLKQWRKVCQNGEIRDDSPYESSFYLNCFNLLSSCWDSRDKGLILTTCSSFSALLQVLEFDSQLGASLVDELFLEKIFRRAEIGLHEEHAFIRDLIHWIYTNNINIRPLVRQHFGRILLQFSRIANKRVAVSELLEVLGHIICGFPKELTIIHKSVLFQILMPLHYPNEMAEWRDQIPIIQLYHEHLVFCIVQFLERSPELIVPVIEQLLSHWPEGFCSNTPKEVLMVHELEKLLQVVNEDLFAQIIPNLLPRIVQCIKNENNIIIKRTLTMWKNDHFNELCKSQKEFIMRPLMLALFRKGKPYWNPTVNKMTVLVLDNLEKYDHELFVSTAESIWSSDISTLPSPFPPIKRKKNALTSVSSLVSGKNNNEEEPVKKHIHQSEFFFDSSLQSGLQGWKPQHKQQQPPPVTITGVAPWANSNTNQKQQTPPLTTTGVAPWSNSQLKQQSQPPLTATGVTPWTLPRQSTFQKPPHSTLLPPTNKHKTNERHDHNHNQMKNDENEVVLSEEDIEQVEVESENKSTSDKTGIEKLRDYMQQLCPDRSDSNDGVQEWHKIQSAPTPTLLPTLKFHDLVFGRDLGSGAFSTVKYARQIIKENNKTRSQWPEFAVKVISKSKMEELGYHACVIREIGVLRVLSHPSITRMVSSFRWRDGIYLVLEYGARGDLHSYLLQHGSFDEASARFVIGEIVAAIASIHDEGFVFGDLKPENIVITEIGHIKLTDFGACRPFTQEARIKLENSRLAVLEMRDGDWKEKENSDELQTRVLIEEYKDLNLDDDRIEGTPAYLPPEVVLGQRPDFSADVWALGCLLFQLLAGKPAVFAGSKIHTSPFKDIVLKYGWGGKKETQKEIMNRIVRFAQQEELDLFPPDFPMNARDLVKKAMEPDMQHRISLQGFTSHQFFDSIDVFKLHLQDPYPLARGNITPEPDALWAQRQHSIIWSPMPQEYVFSAKTYLLDAIHETSIECNSPFVDFI